MSLERILVVDDEPAMLRSVERVLKQSYEVAATHRSKEAVEVAKHFHPELAILDIQMPDIDGFELMEKLKAIDPQLDVILMTGSIYEIDGKLIRSIRKDAFYFLQKPFDREVLLTLVERCFDLKRLHKQNRKHLERMEKELAEARAFQQSLLPPERGELGRVSVFAQYVPCSELAGDFYDYVAVESDAVLLVADVSGHGASAAMLTGIVKSSFHSARADNYEPAAVVDRVAKAIQPFSPYHFISAICARLRAGRLDYVNAGHPAGILAGPRTCEARLASTGPVISPAFSNFVWEQRTVAIPDIHRLVLFTDGIIETESDSGYYGLPRLLEQITHAPADGEALSQNVLNSVRQFAGGRPINDDLTLVVADF